MSFDAKLGFIGVTAGQLAFSIAGLIAAVTVGTFKIIQGNNQKIIESNNEVIESASKAVESYEDEISRLKSLSGKLQEAKNDKKLLIGVTSELNELIGDSSDLLSGEADAFEASSLKIRARIQDLKDLADAETNRKIAALEDNFSSTGENFKVGVDDLTVTGAVVTLDEAVAEHNKFKQMRDKWVESGVKEDSRAIAELDKKIKRYEGIVSRKVLDAQEILRGYIDQHFSDNESRGYMNQYINDLIFGGTTELSDVKSGVSDIVPIIEQYNEVYNSLAKALSSGSSEADTQSATDGAISFIESIKEQYPEAAGLIKLLEDSFSSLGIAAKTSGDAIKATLSDTFKALSDAGGNISTLSSAFKELSKDGAVGFNTLAQIQEAFSEVSGIETYIDALSRAKGNTQETADILNELTYISLVDAMGSIENLANANESLIASMLKANGVFNANEVAAYAVSAANVATSASTAALTGNTSKLIDALSAEASASGVAKGALASLAAQQIITSNTGLNFSQQIAALQGLAAAAFGATSAVAGVFGGTSTGLVNFQRQEREIASGVSQEQAQKNTLNRYWDSIVRKYEAQYNASAVGVNYGGGSGSGSSGGGSAKEVEEYAAKIDKLYKAMKRLEDIKYEIERLEVKSSITDDQQKQIENLNKIVLLYKEQQEAIAEIAELRREDIRENIKKLESKGFIIEYDSVNNDLLIKNLENINNITGSTVEKTNELRKEYEELTDATEKLNDANRESSKAWWNLEQKLKDIKKEYDDIISSTKEVYKSTINAIQKVIDKEKEALELQKEFFEEQKSDMETAVNTVVSFIDKQIDALREENDELDRQIEAQKKLEDLERAKNQRGHKIFVEGKGFIYEADQGKVNSAQQAYDEYKRKVALEEKVKALEDYKKLWQDVTDSYQRGIDEQITADILGASWQRDILNQKTTNIEEYTKKYNYASDQLNEKTKGSVAYQIKQLNELSKQWGNAYDDIESAISDHKINLDVLKSFEKGNYDERLTLLKGYVSSAISELKALQAAQSAAEAAASAGAGGASSGVLAQMQANSAAWHGADAATRQQLAAANQSLGASAGLSYNSTTGTWHDPSGRRAYSEGGVADFTGLAMLHGGSASELILNNADVGKLYEYIHDSPSIIQDMISKVAAGKLIPANSKITPNASQNVSVNINDMHLHGVQDPDGFAAALDKELPGIIRQKLFKNK